MAEKITKSEEDWKKQLSPEQYAVTRKAGTEPAFTGKYWKTKDAGHLRLRVLRAAVVQFGNQV